MIIIKNLKLWKMIRTYCRVAGDICNRYKKYWKNLRELFYDCCLNWVNAVKARSTKIPHDF